MLVIHYGEIALKGDNRKFFEEKLVDNIKKALVTTGLPCPVGSPAGDSFGVFDYVKRISGRILVKLKHEEKGVKLLAEPCKEFHSLQDALQKVFGITYFAFAVQCDLDIEVIKANAVDVLKDKNFISSFIFIYIFTIL